MSFLGKMFGKTGDKAPTPQDAIQRLTETEEMLQKKSDFLEKKIEQEIATARKNGTKNKRGVCGSFSDIVEFIRATAHSAKRVIATSQPLVCLSVMCCYYTLMIEDRLMQFSL